jgi:hypothetical protein
MADSYLERQIRRRLRQESVDSLSVADQLLEGLGAEQFKYVTEPHRFKIARSGRRCLAKGTMVATPKGPKAIEDIAVGDEVYSESGEPIKVIRTYRHGRLPLYRFTNNGSKIADCTEDHKWLSVYKSRGKFLFKLRRLKDFYKGVGIARVEVEAPLGSKRVRHAYALGVLLGDGCAREVGSRLTLSSIDDKIPNKVVKVLDAEGVYNHKNVNNYHWFIYGGVRSRYASGKVKEYEEPYCEYYAEWCRGRYAHEKIVDLDEIKTWDRQSLLEFVAGLLDSDGGVEFLKSNEICISFTSQSDSMVEAFRYAVLALWQVELAKYTDSRSKYVNGPVYYVRLKHIYHCKRILRELDPHSVSDWKKYKPEYDALVPNNFNQNFYGGRYKYLGEGETYDIEVWSPTNLFLLANGAVSSNSGKTYGNGIKYLRTMLDYPGSPNIYLSLTREAGKEAVWDTLLELLDQYKIRHQKWESNMRIELGNGSKFRGVGADSQKAKDRIRGTKHKLACVDECGFVKEVDELTAVILPTLADYQGELAMSSSPPPVLAGWFYEADRGKLKDKYAQYHWTLLDNPHFMRPATDPRFKTLGEQELDAIVNIQFGGNWEHPTFLREYMGQWVESNLSRVYPITDANSIALSELPEKPEFILSMNLSQFPKVAITVCAYTDGEPVCYVVQSFMEEFRTVRQFLDVAQVLMDRYADPLMIGIYGDHKSVGNELYKRGLPRMLEADIRDNPILWTLCGDDIRENRVKIVQYSCRALWDEMEYLMKGDDGQIAAQQNIYLSDSFLHAYRYIHNAVIENYEPPKTEEQRMIELIEKKYTIEPEDIWSKYDEW